MNAEIMNPVPRPEPATVPAIKVAQNLATIDKINALAEEAIRLADETFRVEDAATNVSLKVALAHASNHLLDALSCLRCAGTIARRDA